MSAPLAPVNRSFGPAMNSLTLKQQLFVKALLDTPNITNAEAARRAGYEGDTRALASNGWRQAHDEKVLEAIHEEALKRLNSGRILAVSVMMEIAAGEHGARPADMLKAAEMIANRTGMHDKSEQTITVNHSLDDKRMIKRIAALAKQINVDPQKVLGSVNVVVDADFEEVKEPIAAVEEEPW
jgi:phage terminase small subunit